MSLMPVDQELLIRLDERLGSLEKDVKTIQVRQEHIYNTVQRWKGATVVLLALGGIIAWGTNFLINLGIRVS